MKNKRLFAILLTMVMIFSSAIPVLASQERDRTPTNIEIEHSDLEYTVIYKDGIKYLSGYVILEIGYIDCNEVIRRQYFNITIQYDELNSGYMPIAPTSLIQPMNVVLPFGAAPRFIARAGFHFVGEVTRYVRHHTSDGPSVIWVSVFTAQTGNRLGNDFLNQAQWMRITVPWNTLDVYLWGASSILFYLFQNCHFLFLFSS